jgi:hypothetical protein
MWYKYFRWSKMPPPCGLKIPSYLPGSDGYIVKYFLKKVK